MQFEYSFVVNESVIQKKSWRDTFKEFDSAHTVLLLQSTSDLYMQPPTLVVLPTRLSLAQLSEKGWWFKSGRG